MIIIKRYATSSTNEEIKEIVHQENIAEPACLYSKCQSDGKGQLGNRWTSEPFKNLTCSFYFDEVNIPVENQFNLSVFVALAIAGTLEDLGLKKINIKWPNDILAGNDHKICGTLIENTLSGAVIKSSVIGIGLNVNQIEFPDLPNATSIALELGKNFQIEFVLDLLIKKLKKLNKQNLLSVDFDQYYQKLFSYNESSDFKTNDGKVFKGEIQGITSTGLLQVYNLQEDQLNNYDMKEIKFLDQS